MIISKARISKLFFVMGIFFIDALLFLLCPDMTLEKTMVFVGGFATVTLILIAVFLYGVTREFNFFFLFVVIAFIFEFGQSMATCIGGYDCLNPKWFLNINNGYFSSTEIWKSFFFSHIMMMSLIVGYIFLYRKRQNNSSTTMKRDCVNKKQIRTGFFLLIISMVPTFYLLIKDILILQTLGYGATLQVTKGVMEKIFSLLSEMFPISVIWLLVCDERKQSRYFILGITSIYMGFQLAGGSRIQVFRFAIVIFLIFSLYYKKITKRNIFWLILLASIGVFVLSLVSSIRTSIYVSTDLQELISNAVISLWENNFIIEALKEMGNTQLINALVIKKCPQQVEFAYGTSYMKMLFSVVPNFWGGVHPSSIDVDSVFSTLYTNLCGLGSSFIAEAYWNFGFLAIPFCTFLGMIFAIHDRKLQEMCVNGENKVKIYLGFYVSFLLVFWVRSSCNGFGRSMLYASIPIFISRIALSNTR